MKAQNVLRYGHCHARFSNEAGRYYLMTFKGIVFEVEVEDGEVSQFVRHPKGVKPKYFDLMVKDPDNEVKQG